MLKHIIQENTILDNLASLSKGYHLPLSSKTSKSNINTDKALKVLSLKNIRQLVDKKEVTYSLVEYEQKYNKEIQYIQQHDIIIPSASGVGNFNVIYIEDEPTQKLAINDTMILIRANKGIVNSKYLYIQLLSTEIQQKILSVAKGNPILHISKKDLGNIKVPIFEAYVMDKICNEYDNIQKKKRKIAEEENDFWKNLNK